MSERYATRRQKIAQIIYDKLEGTIANQDMRRQLAQWDLSIEIAEAIIEVTKVDDADEIERLREKCDKQAMTLRRLFPENYPDTLFISGVLGNKDQNNMPERILVCPAFGVDFSYVYEYTGKTIGGMGS